jgi:hypothetical protein
MECEVSDDEAAMQAEPSPLQAVPIDGGPREQRRRKLPVEQKGPVGHDITLAHEERVWQAFLAEKPTDLRCVATWLST